MREQLTRRECVQTGALAAASVALGGGRAMGQNEVGGKTSAQAAPAPDLVSSGSLRTHAEAKGLPVGAAVNMEHLRSSEGYRQVVASQFDMVVGENCMKWGALRPTADTFDFKQADELMDFAGAHGMRVRGHNLCWHEYLPKWFAGAVTKDNAAKVLTEHIRTVAGRYKGRIHSWDVVNEAIWVQDGRPDAMRSSSPWYELLGPGYVELAFRTARQADPEALLTYNDYGIEYDLDYQIAKRKGVLELVRRLHDAKPEGGRRLIDAVGVQSHLKTSNIAKLGAGIRDFVRTLDKMGLPVFLTELDVDDDALADEEMLQQDKDVAAVYEHYLAEMLGERNVRAVLVWGVADSQSWLQGEKWRTKHPTRMERPLPFLLDEAGQYRAKPAFFAMRDAIDAAKHR